MPIDFQKLLSNQDIAKEGLIIDCKSIKLVQNRAGEPNIFEAAGALNVDFRTGITARVVIYEVYEMGIKQLKEFTELANMKSGTLIPASHYYTLTATDAAGVQWTNPMVEVEITRHPTCTVAQVKCMWIRCSSPRENEDDSARMLFIDEVDLPKNVSKFTKISIRGRNFESHEKGGSAGPLTGATILWTLPAVPGQFYDLSVACDPDHSLPANFVAKLVESICVVTASSVAPCITHFVAGDRVVVELSAVAPSQSGLIQPPLMPAAHVSEDFYALLDAYLTDAIATSRDEDFSTVSAILHPLFSTGSLSLNALALLVSVAVESLVNARFRRLAAASPTLIEEVAQLSVAVSDMEISESTMKRALSLLGGMKSSRASDKLYELSKNGKVLTAEIEIWKKLRNTTAHGSLHLDPGKYQQMLNQIYSVNLLLNKLVMTVIGYDGAFNDYSTYGWPVAARLPDDEGAIEHADEMEPS